MRIQRDSPQISTLEADGVEFEKCINSEEAVNTIIAKFPCKNPLVDTVNELSLNAEDIVEGQHDISLDDTLAVQAMLQREWADNGISLTANIPPGIAKKQLYYTIIKWLPKLKGTTIYIDNRPQSPYTRITKDEYDAHEGQKILRQAEAGCRNGICPVK